MKSNLEILEQRLLKTKDPARAKILSHFFKTGPGQYGEGDIFLGIVVGKSRSIAKEFSILSLNDINKLLNSSWHEFRLVALLILIEKYNKADNDITKGQIIKFYLKNLKNVNNWDLVDLSCSYLLGSYLYNKDRSILYKLAKDKNMWSRRVAIVSTYYFIKNNDLKDTFKLAEILLNNKEDLMHKAVGWMLREAGKRDKIKLEKFINKYIKTIPRTTLRYAIEKFPEAQRQKILKIK
ncbi:MAG TPA: DNA alkylation repair protein [bacterium]|jgi:3-methyladenine DNA glycosylase AlkD|nr:DNA alkylation repair protein [bacterium]